MVRILAVEDSCEAQELIRRALVNDYEIDFAGSAWEARESIAASRPDLILLDAGLPDVHGLELCSTLRSDPVMEGTPIVFLATCRKTSEKVMAFKLGADDYVEKPFAPEELRARIEARIRRMKVDQHRTLSFSDLRLDTLRHAVFVVDGGDERPCELTPREFGILHCLASSRGSPVSRTCMMRSAWGSVTVSKRTIDTHVSNLRRKLAPHGDRLQGVRGVGYVLNEPAAKPCDDGAA